MQHNFQRQAIGRLKQAHWRTCPEIWFRIPKKFSCDFPKLPKIFLLQGKRGGWATATEQLEPLPAVKLFGELSSWCCVCPKGLYKIHQIWLNQIESMHIQYMHINIQKIFRSHWGATLLNRITNTKGIERPKTHHGVIVLDCFHKFQNHQVDSQHCGRLDLRPTTCLAFSRMQTLRP